MKYEEFIPDARFELIPIKNLVSNQQYQRNLSMSHINRTIENFDKYQINPVKVSRRDGVNYVINGQHTIEIIAAVSGSRETPVWCMVFEGVEYDREADIFAKQQKYVKRLSPYEIFIANIEAGNDDQLIIRDIVKSYGLSIGSGKKACVLGAVSTLEWVFQNLGYHVLDRTIRLCVGTWEGEVYSLSGAIIKAIAIMVFVYKDDIKDEVFKEKLGIISAKEILRSTRERGGGTMSCVETMLVEYNKRMKSGILHWSKLHHLKDMTRPNDEGNEEQMACSIE